MKTVEVQMLREIISFIRDAVIPGNERVEEYFGKAREILDAEQERNSHKGRKRERAV